MEQLRATASIIANYLISLGAVGSNFKNPIKWASNPFYVDNRRLQSNPEARTVLRIALASLIDKPNAIDYIYGIPKAGIAPATLLALELGKPLLIQHNGDYYSIDIPSVKKFVKSNITDLVKSADVVAGTIPFGIILGIILAEEIQKPFLFIREKPKEHGLMKQVEGIITQDSSAILVDPLSTGIKLYTKDALKALGGFNIEVIKICKPMIDYYLQKEVIKGKRVVVQGDLVSTGKSSLQQILGLLQMKAMVFPRSIFSFNFKTAVENFARHGLINESLLTFSELIIRLKDTGKLCPSDEAEIYNWYFNRPT